MSYVPVVYNQFDGGLSTDGKIGIKFSQAPSVATGDLGTYAIDFRKKPSQLSVLPKTAREDLGVVTDLIQNCVMASDGTTYHLGNTGQFYKRSTTGTYTLIGNVGTGTFGMDYRKDSDTVYICGSTTVSIYGPVTGTPTLTVNKYADSIATVNATPTAAGLNVNPNQSGSGFTYVPPTTVSESSVNLRYFQSDIEPLDKIDVYIQTKGTGDWTLTLHDGLNNTLATKTVLNVNLVNNAFNDFVFSTPQRIYVSPSARTYHIHVTSTVADGALTTSANGDLTGADLEVFANRLISTTNGIHPMARFLQYEVIGNSNYLSVWEPLSDPPTNDEWVRHRLAFPSEYEVCGLSVFNEYLAIALQKVSTSGLADPQEGLIAWWDGLSAVGDNKANYFTRIPEGTPQCITQFKNNIYYYAGGAWYRINSPSAQPVKVRTMPGSDTEFSGATAPLTIYPYAASVRRGVLLMAYPSTTTNTSINYGVYSWGSVDQNFPESFGYSYLLSTGSTNYSVSNNLTIGMVQNFGDTLLISWRDDLNGGYGIDVVNNSSSPAVNASWQSNIFDDGFPGKDKKASYLLATFLTLPSDCSFRLKYKLERSANWTYSSNGSGGNGAYKSTDFTNSMNVARFDVNTANRYTEIQYGIDIVSGAASPIFTSVAQVYDNLAEEALS